ncbi:DNA translocase FtsK 4TM domain-containing protein, partial [Candidatus Saccharibacteria bacterium]|nr:DNA translocase FtsK 4TM domain-containing protein [Candidatus Saccharibacteria bacterium]
MAKKRKKKTRDAGPEHELPGGFWHQVLAVIMLALAVILVMTWFGSGGSLLNHIHAASGWLIGYAAYFLPLLLVYLAIKIFRSDTNRLPLVVWIASFLMVLWLAGIFGIPTIGQLNPTGGVIGEGLNLALTQILDSGVVVFIYVVLIFITAVFILQVSPAAVFRGIINLFSSKKAEDADNAKVARAAEAGEKKLDLKVNPGVAVADSPAPKVKAFDAKKPPAAEPERALMSVSDPDWKMPSVDLLEKKQSPADAGNIEQNALIIKNTFAEFGIDVEMEGANIGPRVTQYTLRAPGGINLAKISARDKELAYKLSAQTVRIEAPIPGTQLIGVEVPNARSATVSLRGIIESDEWNKSDAPLTFTVGKNISGKPILADLASMPHLLI